jgi:hypothetical protein
MPAPTKLVFYGACGGLEQITMETFMTEANFSKKGLGVSGTIILAAFLPNCT